jgi:Fe-S-cluster containining protein
MTRPIPDNADLKTIFEQCRQCGTCCKKYKKVLLQGDEVNFIKKMGGHVGVDATLRELREQPLTKLIEKNAATGKVYMIHPDDKGCIFLECHNGLYRCKIYNFRPLSCRGFRCNLADDSFLSLFADNAIHLLGRDSFGLPLQQDN